MKKVCDDHVSINITGEKADTVVMQETNDLMSNPANATRLAEAIDEIEKLIASDKL